MNNEWPVRVVGSFGIEISGGEIVHNVTSLKVFSMSGVGLDNWRLGHLLIHIDPSLQAVFDGEPDEFIISLYWDIGGDLGIHYAVQGHSEGKFLVKD